MRCMRDVLHGIGALRGAAAALVIALGVIGSATSSEALSKTVITLDERSSFTPSRMSHVRLRRTARASRASLRSQIIARDRSFGETFHCVDVNGHPASVVPQLLDLASQQPGVRQRV